MEQRNHNPEVKLESKEYYTYLVQILIDAFNAGQLPEVERITVEPNYGYVATLTYINGEHRVVYGHDPGLNPSSSREVVKDKGYTKFILRENEINHPAGDEFLLPWWANALRSSDKKQYDDIIKDTDQAHSYIEQNFGYPLYVKPSQGSQGVGVTRVHSEEELKETFDYFEQERVKVAIVEEELRMPDYRLLVFDGELVNAYHRKPLSIEGDGVQTIEELIEKKHASLLEQGRDIHMEQQRPLIEKRLGRQGLIASDVIQNGEYLQLLDISNLSAGGTPEDIMQTIHPRWAELAAKIAKVFDLRVCGVDLACADIESGESEYSVIEVNSTPGAKQFMATGEGEQEYLKQLFIRFFRTA